MMAGKLPRASHIHVWLRKLENSWELFLELRGEKQFLIKCWPELKVFVFQLKICGHQVRIYNLATLHAINPIAELSAKLEWRNEMVKYKKYVKPWLPPSLQNFSFK